MAVPAGAGGRAAWSPPSSPSSSVSRSCGCADTIWRWRRSGLIFIIQGLATNLDGYTRGALGLNGLPELTNLWWVYGWMLVTLYVCWKLKHSSLGRTMLAIRENELAAACLGVKITRTRILSFALGAFFAGVAGGLWAHLVTLVTPTSFTFLFAFQLVVMVVLGGSGSITGAALVAAVAHDRHRGAASGRGGASASTARARCCSPSPCCWF